MIQKKQIKFIFIFVIGFLGCRKDPVIYLNPIAEKTLLPFALEIDIYPNPCKEIFTIQTNTTDSQNVILYDVLGVPKLNLTIKGTTAIINKNLVTGLYLLSISSKYDTINKKLIVGQ